MGQQIIKQPDGLYSIMSSVTDTFIVINATARDVLDHVGGQARRDAEERALRIMDQLERGEEPYHQFTMTWQEALATHREHAQNSDPGFNRAVERLAKKGGAG